MRHKRFVKIKNPLILPFLLAHTVVCFLCSCFSLDQYVRESPFVMLLASCFLYMFMGFLVAGCIKVPFRVSDASLWSGVSAIACLMVLYDLIAQLFFLKGEIRAIFFSPWGCAITDAFDLAIFYIPVICLISILHPYSFYMGTQAKQQLENLLQE